MMIKFYTVTNDLSALREWLESCRDDINFVSQDEEGFFYFGYGDKYGAPVAAFNIKPGTVLVRWNGRIRSATKRELQDLEVTI